MIEVSWNQKTYMDDREVTEQMGSIDQAHRFIKLCNLAAPNKGYRIQNINRIL